MCPSGLRSTLGKRVCGQPYRRFESSRFRQKLYHKNDPVKGSFFMIAGRSPAEDSLPLRRRTEKASFFWFSSWEANFVFSAKKQKKTPRERGFEVS